MSDSLATNYLFFIALMEHYFSGDAFAALIFESEDFKKDIDFWYSKRKKALLDGCRDGGAIEQAQISNIDADLYTLIGIVCERAKNADSLEASIFNSREFQKSINSRVTRSLNNALEIDDHNKVPAFPLEFIVSGPKRAMLALKNIRKWLKGARDVIIVDPYIFSPPVLNSIFSSEMEYIRAIKIIVPKTCAAVKFYACGFYSRIRNPLIEALKDGRQINFIDTTHIHDRFIIKDRKEAKYIGTSFGGFGRKVFAINDLPIDDVSLLVDLLIKIERKENLPD